MSCPWNRSTRPLELGWYAVVQIRFGPNNCTSSFHRHESNWRPLSVEIVEGTPNRAIQLLTKDRATVSAMILAIGMASGPPCEPIDTGEYISKSIGRRKWANDVDVHHIKPRIRSGEGRKGYNRMSMNF